MPDIWMDVDVALSEVPVNVLPLLDDTDGKTIEASVAYDAAGMALKWNFVTTAGAYTQTAVTPTTSGNYDWTSQGNGMYSLEIPASGGASINNDTEGFGWFSGVATGVLPWRGPVIGFRAAAINNSLVDGAAISVSLTASQIAVKKNTALANFMFVMYDSTDHITPKTGLTPACQRSIDGGAFANCDTATATEISAGAYKVNLAASDLNGTVILLKFSATGADTLFMELLTQA